MKTVIARQFVNSAALVVIGFLVTPVSGASTIATSQQELAAMHVVALGSLPSGSGLTTEHLQPTTMLASSDASDLNRIPLSRYLSPAPATARSELSPEMGLQLPEPGPLSAILATLALAGFVMLRRSV